MDTSPLDPDFESLLEYLKSNYAFDFTGYKRSSLSRRMHKRMEVHGIATFADYRHFLSSHPEECVPLFDTIMINVTAFFRDAEAWEYLDSQLLPRLTDRQLRDKTIRVWSAGCASGQEPYTVAILLAERLGIDEYSQRVKIYATDSDEQALETARRATYTEKEVEGVPPQLLAKYFQNTDGQYTIHSQLRRSLIFGRHDLMADAPISNLDLLLCRNALMYFNAEAQGKILRRFYFALRPEGYLFLGRAEMLLTHGDMFSPVELRHRIFVKVARTNFADEYVPMLPTRNAVNDRERGIINRLKNAACDVIPVAQVVLDTNGQIAYFNECARTTFGLIRQDVGRKLKDLELSYRPVELRSLIDRALTERRAIISDVTERKISPSETQHLQVTVTPLERENNIIGISVTFQDVTHQQQLHEHMQRFAENLETAYEELQSANEELETTNEELQSANEELETTNEELQAANEEMEMMNEELRSTNEDIHAANQQLREHSEAIDQANAFLRSVLSSLRSGVAVIDRDLIVRTWNDVAQELWGLRSDEVEGKNIFSLDIGLPMAELEKGIRKCLDGSEGNSQTHVTAVNRRGRKFHCMVTMGPLLSSKQELVGAVLLMDEWNQAEQESLVSKYLE